MEQKQQFVSLVGSGRFTITELCLEFKISRKTGHKWLLRHEEEGMAGLEDRSRAPKCSAGRTSDNVERLIVTERRLHPTWGPKKIRRILETKHGIETPPAVRVRKSGSGSEIRVRHWKDRIKRIDIVRHYRRASISTYKALLNRNIGWRNVCLKNTKEFQSS